MIVLGLAAFVHDSAACLIRDGKIIANAEEERFNRVQHTNAFPAQALTYVLEEGNIQLEEVDVIAFNWNPYKSLIAELLKVIFLPVTYLKVYRYSRPPKNFRSIFASLLLKRNLRKHFSSRFKGRIIWVDHHLAHAASSYYLAPFTGSAADIVVVDGHGDDSSASVYSVENNKFTLQWKIPIFDSLGIIYTNFTRFLGFDSYQEGKTMALASFGRDTFSRLFEKIIVLKPAGKYEIAEKKYLAVWNYLHNGLESEIGKRREREAPLEQRHFDLACSMQNRVKEAILHMIRHVSSITGHDNLGLSGGVFLNCDINSHILNSNQYRHVFVPPFPSDSGGAAGAALYAACARCNEVPEQLTYFSPYLGPAYSEAEIVRALGDEGVVWEKVEAPWEHASRALQEGRVIGWFQGRMECGPRALGNRSILANPMGEGIRDHLNSQVKRREHFGRSLPLPRKKRLCGILTWRSRYRS